MALGIGGGVGDFAHAGLHVDEDDGVAGGGFAGGLVGDGAGDRGGVRRVAARRSVAARRKKSWMRS